MKRGVNPINVGCRLIQALQEVSSFEIRPSEFFSLVCNFFDCDSTAANVTPNLVTIRGVLRTTSQAIRATGLRRIDELTAAITSAYNCKGMVTYERSVGPMITDEALCNEMAQYISEIVGPEKMRTEPFGQGAEDFAAVCREVPGMFINLGAGHPSEGYTSANHTSTVRFNEDVLPIGAAIHANCAFNWLNNHKD